ncbi:hypothetical protein ABK040_009604 [Willaertia magna]
MKRNLAIVFDIDGVLIHDGKVIDGVIDILNDLYKHHIPFVFVTNGGGETEEERATFLSTLFGIKIDPERIILAHTPLRKHASPNEKVLYIGRNEYSCDKIMENYGFKNRISLSQFREKYPMYLPYTMKDHENYFKFNNKEQLELSKNDKINSIVVLDTPVDWLESLQICCDLLLSDGRIGHQLDFTDPNTKQEVNINFCNPDLVYQGICIHPRFTQGAFRECLNCLFLKMNHNTLPLNCKLFGKPFEITYNYAKEILLEQLKKYHQFENDSLDDLTIYAIGDNPLSDIKGANENGLISILVRTGVFNNEQLENDLHNPARYVFPSVNEAFQFICKQLN